MRLHIRVFRAKERLGAIDGQLLDAIANSHPP